MKRLFLVVGLVLARSAFANYPVFDATNFAKMVENVQLMQQQLMQLKATYESLNGSRGLGAVLYNPALRQYLPDEWKGIYDAAASGRYAGISGKMRDIQEAERLAGTVAQQIKQMQERRRSSTVANKALGLQAFDGAKERLKQIESLMSQINLTKDPKAVAEIQARIAVEQAAVANEATKLQLVSMLQQAEEKLEAEQRRELGRKILDPANTGMPDCCEAQ